MSANTFKLLGAVMTLAIAFSSFASQILKKSVQEKARQADLVVIAKVGAVRDTRLRDSNIQFEKWVAESELVETICGSETNKLINVGFFIKPQAVRSSLPQGNRLEQSKTYILFLRRDSQNWSLLDPWDSSEEVSGQYVVWDEDLKDDKEALKMADGQINGVPSVTLDHGTYLEKIRAAWQKKGTAGSQGVTNESNGEWYVGKRLEEARLVEERSSGSSRGGSRISTVSRIVLVTLLAFVALLGFRFLKK